MNRRLAAGVGALLMSGVAAANAPFCVVTDHQSFCHYYDINTCRQAAAAHYGAAMCAANPQRTQAQAVQPYRPAPTPAQSSPWQQVPQYDIAEGMRQVQEAGERGRRAGQARAEHRERMRLLEAQQEQVRLQNELLKAKIERERATAGTELATPSPATEFPTLSAPVEYKCVSPHGAISYAPAPKAGSECRIVDAPSPDPNLP